MSSKKDSTPLPVLPHSQSEKSLASTHNSWTNLKEANGRVKRSNTAQNLQFYVEEQKRLYEELPFMALPGMRRRSFARERSMSTSSSMNSFYTKHGEGGENTPLLSPNQDDYFNEEPGYTKPLVLSTIVALLSAVQFGYNTGITGALSPELIFPGHESWEWSLTVSAFPIGKKI